MKRRDFLGTGLAAAGGLALGPAIRMAPAGASAGGFWAKYLTALHGPVPAAHIARFSGTGTAFVAAGAAGQNHAAKALHRRVARLGALADDGTPHGETERPTLDSVGRDA